MAANRGRLDYLAAMRAFARAVELGSFSRAAAVEGVKVSTVSRYVAALEADLGAALFNRSTRRLHLTEAGTLFYARAGIILRELDEARLATTSLNALPQGLLRLNVPGAFGRHHIVPHLGAFQAAFPQVRLDVTLTDETVDLIATGTDVAVRIGALSDSSLMALKLAPQRRILVASPAYLDAAGAPETPGALARHRCLLFDLQPADLWYWRAAGGKSEPVAVPITGPFRANDSDALLEAARAGLGLALLPSWLLADDLRVGRLQQVLAECEWTIAPGPERAIWGVYPPKKTVPPKARAFLDFIAERFGKPPYWEQGLPGGVPV